MPLTNASAHFSALGREAAIVAFMQIPVEKRRELARKVEQRQQQQALNQKAGTDA